MTIKYISIEYIFNSIMRTLRQIIFSIINSFAQPLTAYTAFIFQVISSFLSNLMLIPIFKLIINFFDQIRINVGSFFIQMYDTIFSFISSLFNPVQFLYENVFKKIYNVLGDIFNGIGIIGAGIGESFIWGYKSGLAIFSNLTSFLISFYSQIVEVFKSITNSIYSLITSSYNGIGQIFSDLYNNSIGGIYTALYYVFGGIANAIISSFKWVWDTFYWTLKLLTYDVAMFIGTILSYITDHIYKGILFIYSLFVWLWEYIFGKKENFTQFNPNEGVVGFLKSMLYVVVTHVYNAIMSVRGGLEYIWKLFTIDILGFFTTIFSSNVSHVYNVIMSVGSTLQYIWNLFTRDILGFFTTIFDSIVSHGHSIFMFFTNWILIIFNFLSNLFTQDIFGLIKNGFMTIINLCIVFFTISYNTIIFVARLLCIDLFSGVYNFGKTIVEGIIKTFVYLGQALISFIVNPVSGVLDLFKNLFLLILSGIETFARYVYVIGVNTIYNPISSIGSIFTTLGQMILNIFTNIFYIFIGLASSFSDLGSDIYYFIKLFYNFIMDLMNFNVAVSQTTSSVISSANNITTSSVVTPISQTSSKS